MARGYSNELDYKELCDSRSSGGDTQIRGEGEEKVGQVFVKSAYMRTSGYLQNPIDDNLGYILASLGITNGKFLSIVDEENELGTIAVTIGHLP